MSLKAVLFDFNGIMINDESIHQRLIEEILLSENLVLKPGEYEEICLGRSDRACLRDILNSRGRVVSEDDLTGLLVRKAQSYAVELEKLEKLPLYPGLEDLIFQIRSRDIKLGIVSGAIRQEIELVLERSKLAEVFSVIVSGDDITTSKPEPDGYKLAVQLLNQKHPQLNLQAKDCLAIEDTPSGITAAKRAGMQVVGVANTYPFHMLQRQANWTIDYFTDLELERVQEVCLQLEA
ncbi:MAG: HAD family phosphatase [Calothrix sp. MO_192.B10]|nr:HAD family phosphatase [Calothrix sp. MO_192.B10]